MKKISTLIIAALLLCSLGNGYLEVVANMRQSSVSDTTRVLWGIVFVMLSAMWVQRDAEEKHLEEPFDFGFLVYLLLPVALPYHLIKTRGAKGMLATLGFLGLYLLPFFLGLLTYTYYS